MTMEDNLTPHPPEAYGVKSTDANSHCSAPSGSAWVNKHDALPPFDVTVLVSTDYGKMDVCRLQLSEDGRTLTWVNDMRPQHSNGSVTHWRNISLPNSKE